MSINISNSKYKKGKRGIQCINCGFFGHTSKFCNHPTTSYGVVCFRIRDNNSLEYLMVQRKDSLCYVEFLRGKYEIENKNYIIQMFENMTLEECNNILNKSFDELWDILWVDNKRKNMVEYKATKEKYNLIKTGYIIKSPNDSSETLFDIHYILKECRKHKKEQEWDFPKGRRKLGEDDIDCAQREFIEESGVKLKDIISYDNSKQFEETYSGTNKIRYRNIYYIKQYISIKANDELFNKSNTNQIKEIRDVKWLNYDSVIEKISDRNIEKFEVFKRIHSIILKKLKSYR